MTMTEADRIGGALAAISSIKCITRGWPAALDSQTLPCVVVQKAGERGVDVRDNREYITELEYYIRVFAATAPQADQVSAAVLQTMEALGYERVFAWEEFTQEVYRADMRLRRYC